MKTHPNWLALEDRVFLGILMLQNAGIYGYVTDLSRRYGVSRWFLYFSCRNLYLSLISDFLSQQHTRMLGLCENLEEVVLCLYLEGESSLEGIQQILSTVLKQPLSMGAISTIINEYGSLLPTSSRIEERFGFPILFNVDEIFQNGSPILEGVDPLSLWIYSLELSDCRDQSQWESHFSLILPENPEGEVRITSDRAIAIVNTIEQSESNLKYQSDHWHSLIKFDRYLQTLEERAYFFIDKEFKNFRKLQRSQNPTDRQYFLEQIEIHAPSLQKSIEDYETFSLLLKWLRESLWWIVPTSGNIRSAKQAQVECEMIVQWMIEEIQTLDSPKPAVQLTDSLQDHLQYYQGVQEVEEKLDELFEESIHRPAFWLSYDAYCRSFSTKGLLKKKWTQEYLDWKQIVEEELGVPIYQQALQIAQTLIRSSSWVENVNSRLRRFIDSSRGQLNQNRLKLIRFYLNHQIFRRGKRQDCSPAQLVAEEEQPIHWLEVLREIKGQKEKLAH